MSKISLFLFLGTLVFFACKQKKNEPMPPKDYISDNVPADFLDFYEQFHSNEEFQLKHIIFPLDGARQDTSTLEMYPIKWQKENWRVHEEFNSYNGTYKRNFTNLQGIIIETISDKGNRFSMERRFSKLNAEWNLIFYSEFQLIKNEQSAETN